MPVFQINVSCLDQKLICPMQFESVVVLLHQPNLRIESNGDITSLFRPHRVEDGPDKCLPILEIYKSLHSVFYAATHILWV
jgi:hypothetical protein